MYLLMSGIAKMLELLSFNVLERLAGALTFLFFDIFRIRRKLMLRNLSIAFGESYTARQRGRLSANERDPRSWGMRRLRNGSSSSWRAAAAFFLPKCEDQYQPCSDLAETSSADCPGISLFTRMSSTKRLMPLEPIFFIAV